MILLDYKDRRPLYEQIVDKFSDMILKGVLKPDEKMPSVRNLAMELSINPNTIQRAYMELERRGFLYSVKGRGNFVSDNDHLKEERKLEIKLKLKEQIKEASIHGVGRQEIEELLQSIYATEKSKSEPDGQENDQEKCQKIDEENRHENARANRIDQRFRKENDDKGGKRHD